MVNPKSPEKYLSNLKNQILIRRPKISVELTRNWTKHFTKEAGVYVLFEKNKLVYVGESGSVKGRMTDLLDSRHHQVRRNIGRIHFSKIRGFKDANSRKKFPKHIELKVNNWLKKRTKISFLPVPLGRKELEEKIIKDFNPKYNNKGKRK